MPPEDPGGGDCYGSFARRCGGLLDDAVETDGRDHFAVELGGGGETGGQFTIANSTAADQKQSKE